MLYRIISIAKKDALIRFTVPTELLFFFILPVVFTFTLGGGFGGAQTGLETLTLAVVDNDSTALTAELLAVIDETETVQIEMMSQEKAEADLREGKVAAVLILPAGFSTAVLAGEPQDLEFYRLSRNNDGLFIEQVVQSAISQTGQSLNIARQSVLKAEAAQPFATDAESQTFFSESAAAAQASLAAMPNRLEVTVPAKAANANDPYAIAAHQSAGQLVTWVLIPLLGISTLFASERTHGTLRRLLTTPTKKSTYLFGTISGQLVLAFLQMALLIGFGALVMGLNWGRSPAGLSLMMISFGAAAVALGTMIGTLTKNEMQAGNLSIMLGMVMALLGGCWWPLELFPQALQTAVKVLPTTWAMQGFSDIVLRGSGVIEVLPEAAVLFGFAAIFFFIGISRFKYE